GAGGVRHPHLARRAFLVQSATPTVTNVLAEYS
ncbi:hypothetical protein EV188_107254, partial [Actinomycetospora succinea]